MIEVAYLAIGIAIGFVLGRLLHVPPEYDARPLPPRDLPEPPGRARRPLA